MKEKWNETKTWFGKNKGKICAVAYTAAVAALGYLIGDKYSELRIAKGLQKVSDRGMIKYFDPDTNQEVSMETALDALNEMIK